MLASLVLANGQAAHLEFGTPLDPQLERGPFYSRMLADYDRRRDELWDVQLHYAWRLLVEALDEARHDAVRLRTVVRAIGDLGWFEPAPQVEPLVEHDDRAVRLAAVRALGQLARFATIRRVGGFLLPESPMEFRREATIAIGKFGIPPLVSGARFAAGDDPELRVLAQQAEARATAHFAKDYHAVVAATLETDEFYDLHSWIAFVTLPLQAVLQSPRRSDEARARAAAILGVRRNRKVAPALLRFVVDEDIAVGTRAELLCAIGRCRLPNVAPTVLPFLDHAEPRLQDHAAIALGRLGDARARVPLLAHWDARAGALRDLLRVAVRRVSPADGAALLMERLQREDDVPVASAAFILDDETIVAGLPREALEALLNNRNAEARRDAALALTFYGDRADFPRLAATRDREGDPRMRAFFELCLQRRQRRDPIPLPTAAPWAPPA